MGKIRMKDIADSLGVSVSTVSRVLNGNEKISEKTRQSVFDKMLELNYKPPELSQTFRERDSVHIIVLCPYDIFFETIISGMETAQKKFGANRVHIEYKFFHMDNIAEQTKLLREIADVDHLDGVAVAPAHQSLLNPLIDQLVEKGIPVVTFCTDAPESKRIQYIGQHAFVASSMAAQLCGAQLRQGEDIAVVSSFSSAMVIQGRTDGFLTFIHSNYPFLKTLGPFQFPDTIEAAQNIAEQVILIHADLKAIYTNNMVGTIGCARAVKATGNAGKIFVVGYDRNEEIERYINEGIVFSTVLQEPFYQGYQAVETLLRLLSYGAKMERPCTYVKCDLLMKSTLPLLIHRDQSKDAFSQINLSGGKT